MVTTLNPSRSVSNWVLQLTVPEPLPRVLVKLMHSVTTFSVQSVTFGKIGHGSQTSPTPSWSPSAWSEFGVSGQLSQRSPTPSPSRSAWLALVIAGQLSQASPKPSLSRSAWLGLDTVRQLSQTSPTPSPSTSD